MNFNMIKNLLDSLNMDATISEVYIFYNWVIVRSIRYAMSTLLRGMPGLLEPQGMNTYMGDIIGKSVLDIADEYLKSQETLKRAVGMATLKSLLPVPKCFLEGNAIDHYREFARVHPTCFIGHFAEAESWRAEGDPVNIIELFPRPGDIHWNDSHKILAEAELVLMTGLTIVNGTFDEAVRRTPRAKYRVIMGPTVPLSPVLFDYGVDQIGGTIIQDPEKSIHYCSLGGGSIANAPAGALRKINLVK
ncbi:MAG TPA: DUF364 domain-containing protein [Chitinispirillaceae bacterium]|nr:DUF364 domain-containing protein [Chitinispirillaceae bacterium]